MRGSCYRGNLGDYTALTLNPDPDPMGRVGTAPPVYHPASHFWLISRERAETKQKVGRMGTSVWGCALGWQERVAFLLHAGNSWRCLSEPLAVTITKMFTMCHY